MIDDNVALSWYCWRQDTLLNRSIDATFNQRTFWKERLTYTALAYNINGDDDDDIKCDQEDTYKSLGRWF